MANRRWNTDYRPLRITATLAGPIAMLPHDGLPLDSVLEFAAFRQGWQEVLQHYDANGERYLPRMENEPANFILPVKRIGHKVDPDWYWSASWVEFPEGYEVDRVHWNRRFDGADAQLGKHLTFMGRSEKINVTSGRYKAYHMPMCLIVAPIAQWFCLGTYDGIAQLLQSVTHLGKKRSQGYGEVLRWTVEACREDYSCWRDGQPMRAVPDQPGNFTRQYHGIRPPYWHHLRRRFCITPSR